MTTEEIKIEDMTMKIKLSEKSQMSLCQILNNLLSAPILPLLTPQNLNLI